MMQPSRALVPFGVVSVLIGIVASDEHTPPLALYVPPVAMPGLQTMPAAAPSAITPPRSPQMYAAPGVPVAPRSFMMPTTVDSPGVRMPVEQPSMDATPQFLPIADAP